MAGSISLSLNPEGLIALAASAAFARLGCNRRPVKNGGRVGWLAGRDKGANVVVCCWMLAHQGRWNHTSISSVRMTGLVSSRIEEGAVSSRVGSGIPSVDGSSSEKRSC